MRASFSNALVCGILAVLAIRGGAAQETVNYGSISGRISDVSGGLIEKARIVVRQIDTNLKHEALTGKDGRFRFPYLPIGGYELRVQHPGFAEAARTVTLTIGSAFEFPITLAVRSTETNITSKDQPSAKRAQWGRPIAVGLE